MPFTHFLHCHLKGEVETRSLYPGFLGMGPKKWSFISKGRRGSGGEEAFHRGQIWPNEREMIEPLRLPPSRWELTPWSLITVQMSGRAFLSTSWTSKAWKPAARKQDLHRTTADPGTAVHPPLKRSPRGKAAERWMDQVERQLLGIPKPTRPSDRDGTA